MQFLVPQFIETEDKVVGPLTLRQFGWIAAASSICFALFFVVNLTLWIVFTVIIGGCGAVLAFGSVNGRPMPHVIRAAWNYFWQPQQYTWQTAHIERADPAKKAQPNGPSFEKIVANMALKTAWRVTATGSKEPEAKTPPVEAQHPANERYQIFHGITGEKRAAKRIDYR